jgi:hypothetical protein
MAKIHFIDAPYYQETETPQGFERWTNSLAVFLIGPILGTWEWQEYAKKRFQYLASQDQSDLSIIIYNPRQPQFKDQSDFDDSTFSQQVGWEHFHLNLTKIKGVRMAWLANKTVELGRNYCLTTLFELGEIIGDTGSHRNAVVGIEPGFTNEKYLQYTLDSKAPEIELTNNLDDACDLTMQMLLRLKKEKEEGLHNV